MFNKSETQVFAELNSNKNGLSAEEAASRLKNNGENKLNEQKKKSLMSRFLLQFKDVLITILLIAALVSVVTSVIEKTFLEMIDAAVILLVVVVNAIIGVVQENKADKAMEALKNMTKPFCKVIRNGKTVKIKTEEVVVGDIVVLEAGDIVPADLRLFEIASLKVEESALTGESVPVEKNLNIIDKQSVPIGDRFNMAFMGSVVSYGRGKGVVVSTGMNTEIGKIADALTQTEEDPTPLTVRIQNTGKTISLIILSVCVLILIMGLLRGAPFMHTLMVSIAIAVCAIPEGLPAALTITMSLGVQEMSKNKAIIRKLPAVETLGSTQVICSDKTGTLTLNKMTVKQIYLKNIPNYVKDIENVKVLPEQDFDSIKKNKNITHLINSMLLCNDTQLRYENEVLSTVGDPTETALVHYGFINRIFKDKLEGSYPRIDEVPFDSERKLMTTIHQNDDYLVSYTKGAVDNLILKCTQILDNGKIRDITKRDIDEILKVNHIYGSHAQRVLGFAFKLHNYEYNKKTIEENLVFVGLCGMIDPPREEVFEAIKVCKKAGILPVMITGDHKDTAFAIAKQLNIATSNSQVITGVELDELSDEQLFKLVNKYRVYARVNPEHKVRIVKAFKKNNKIVAMTGDGVNDAPSIKAADIGVGMGISGTDVTKGVADMILTDDNFSTIVTAVKEGRRIYNNILKIVQFLVTTSIAEIILMATIIAFMGREFFSPLLILYINFVSDTIIALSLGAEKAEPDIMNKSPNTNKGSILLSNIGVNILYMSIIQSILIFALYFLSLNVWGFNNIVTITMCFVALTCMELFHAYNLKSNTESIFKIGVFSNKLLNYAFVISFIMATIVVLLPIPGLHQVMGIIDLNFIQWIISIGFAFSIIPAIEIAKLFIRLFNKTKSKNKNKTTKQTAKVK